MDDLLRAIFVIANLGIMAGYGFVSVFVAPHLKVRLRRTKIGGVIFFLTCGLTHLELALHAAFTPEETYRDMFLSWHMFVIHVVQVASIWSFVTGLYREFVLPGRSSSRNT